MDREILLLLVGGGIGLAGASVGALVNYFLQRHAQLSQWEHEKMMRREQWSREDIDSLRAGRDIRPTLRGGSAQFACFPSGTLIAMQDGSQKAIESLQGDDELRSYDIDSLCFTATKVTGLFKGQASELYCLNEVLRTTSSHLVFANGQFSRARDLLLGNSLLDDSGEPKTLVSLSLEYGERDVLNIDTAANQGFFANGFLVGTKASKVMPGRTGDTGAVIVEPKEAE